MLGRRLRYLLPVAAFAALAVALGIGLKLDPSYIPSVLIDKPVPQFDLPPVAGRERGLVSADLAGDVRLLNFFASWCFACKVEHPLFNRLAEEGTLPVYGINYKDKPADARAWLDKLGDPYRRAGADIEGRTGIDFGVYGLPETFVVDRGGRIVYKHVGPLQPADLEQCIMPVVEQLRAADQQLASINLPTACQRTEG